MQNKLLIYELALCSFVMSLNLRESQMIFLCTKTKQIDFQYRVFRLRRNKTSEHFASNM
jgi:hypothetical protein